MVAKDSIINQLRSFGFEISKVLETPTGCVIQFFHPAVRKKTRKLFGNEGEFYSTCAVEVNKDGTLSEMNLPLPITKGSHSEWNILYEDAMYVPHVYHGENGFVFFGMKANNPTMESFENALNAYITEASKWAKDPPEDKSSTDLGMFFAFLLAILILKS